MTKTLQNAKSQTVVAPSIVDPATANRFTLDQELEAFGKWTGDSIWVPPKDSSKAMAQSMLRLTGDRKFSRLLRWQSVVKEHRSEFTHVREIQLRKASIRLPKGRFFVSLTEQKDFDTITDPIPDCVQTRLEEFLAGPGQQRGVEVYYLEPLCVEIDDKLILTSEADLMAAITKIQEEVFREYRRLYFCRLPGDIARGAVNAAMAIPRHIINYGRRRQQKAIDAYHAHLEFKRRRTALGAAEAYQECRTDGCTFDEMLALTNPLEQEDVIEQFGIEHDYSKAKRQRMIQIAAGTLPWFLALSVSASYLTLLKVAAAAPVAVADPAFIAIFPNEPTTVYKIGHFDQIAGVTHVEI